MIKRINIRTHNKQNKRTHTYKKKTQKTTEAFKEVNRTSYYYLKKSIRKILRNTKKNIRYSKKKQTEVELILFYCNKLKNLSPPISKSIPLTRIFEREILRVEKIVTKLDADLQYDYGNEIEIIRNE